MDSENLHQKITSLTEQFLPELEELYKTLHLHPELSGQESNTAARIGAELSRSGAAVHHGISGHGLVGVLENGPGKCLLIRADMDALPLKEETGLPYLSRETAELDGRKVGIMHACGHDLHCTCLVGVAHLLANAREHWGGKVLFIGQPAEETIGGAAQMLEENIYQRFGYPDACVALHADPFVPAGSVGLSPGVQSSCNTAVDLTVFGIGGHGASPHHTKDPIVLAAQIITALQTIVSREINPRDMGLITVGAIHGGTKRNIIPEQVELKLTLRAYEKQIADQLLTAIHRTATGLARAYGLPEELMPRLTLPEPSFLPVVNEPGLTQVLTDAFTDFLGSDHVLPCLPSTGSEDFSFFAGEDNQVPLVMFRLGVTDPDRLKAAAEGKASIAPLHDPRFCPHLPTSLTAGVSTLSCAALSILKNEFGDSHV